MQSFFNLYLKVDIGAAGLMDLTIGGGFCIGSPSDCQSMAKTMGTKMVDETCECSAAPVDEEAAEVKEIGAVGGEVTHNMHGHPALQNLIMVSKESKKRLVEHDEERMQHLATLSDASTKHAIGAQVYACIIHPNPAALPFHQQGILQALSLSMQSVGSGLYRLRHEHGGCLLHGHHQAGPRSPPASATTLTRSQPTFARHLHTVMP